MQRPIGGEHHRQRIMLKHRAFGCGIDMGNHLWLAIFKVQQVAQHLAHFHPGQAGVGFVKAPKMSVLFMGRPLNKAQFDAMILAVARSSRPEA